MYDHQRSNRVSSFDLLIEAGLNFITGIPCSIFKGFLKEIDGDSRFQHIHASDEAEAIGIAAGYYLATGKPAIVYMQNSGLGNAIDLLTSLTNEEMYAIPMLLFISWRGKNDVIQHKKMGEIMWSLLRLLDISIFFELESAIEALDDRPIAVIFERGLC